MPLLEARTGRSRRSKAARVWWACWIAIAAASFTGAGLANSSGSLPGLAIRFAPERSDGGWESLESAVHELEPSGSVSASAARLAAPDSLTPIHSIQGSGSTSPLTGQVVVTSGIVTARKRNGFFIQAPDSEADSDPNTSEGIFVFTSTSPPSTAALGNLVTVSGSVQEFRPSSDPNSSTLTEISGSPVVTVVSAGNTLPPPVTLTASDANPAGSLEQLERFEGMRVHVSSLTVVAPTGGTVDEASATASSNGIFYGVITGVARPFREPGIQLPDPLPAGAPTSVPRFDANPEKLRVDSNGLLGASIINVTAGVTITNLTGVLDYGSRAYTILPDPSSFPAISQNLAATAVPAQPENELTVASFNMERFFDTENDPHTSDVALTPAAFNARLNKASLAIRDVMKMPDVIGVEEMENLSTLQAVADRVNSDALANEGVNPAYQPYLIEGNDPGGIDVGLLVKSSRVGVLGVTQEGKTATFIDPTDGSTDTLNDRPPLVLRASISPASGPVFFFTVIVSHLRSLTDIGDAAAGPRVRAKRRAQAESLASLIQSLQMANPAEHIISAGDFNAFQFNDGYVDVIGTVKGTPAPSDQVVLASPDLVNPDLIDLAGTLEPGQRYSFVFDGNAQLLDHILISSNLAGLVDRMAYARCNADFPEVFRNDATRPERISDHDMPVAYFKLPATTADLAIAIVDSPAPVPTGSQLTHTITITNLGPGAATDILVHDSRLPPEVGIVVPNLAPGGADSLRVTQTVTEPPGSIITYSASVTSGSLDPNPQNNSATIATSVGAPAPIILNARLSGKMLIVTGSGFQVGAIVEFNLVRQKTFNDAQSPSTVLVVKKAKNNLIRGLDVFLTVLNPDGVRSRPIIFTRP